MFITTAVYRYEAAHIAIYKLTKNRVGSYYEMALELMALNEEISYRTIK